MGAVTEPYLAGTPNVAAFLERLILRRFTFGEAAYASQGAISWQTTVVGDPLYQPFGTPPDVLHFRLEREKNPLIEWSHLRVLDLNQAAGAPPVEMIKYLAEFPLTKQSPVLMEKMGDLHRGPKPASAVEDYNVALKLNPSPLQKVRLLLTIAEIELSLGRNQQAFDAYKQLVTDAPDYPNVRFICQQLADLARRLGKTEEAEKFAKQAEPAAAPK
jgi:tetratricopeptide (TPR) repeat protein